MAHCHKANYKNRRIMKLLQFFTLERRCLLLAAGCLFACHVWGQWIVYETGFEKSEGFTSSEKYNDENEIRRGPVSKGMAWGVVYGATSGTAPLTGDLSLQMRVYKSQPVTPYAQTLFTLNNVDSVTFNATYTTTKNSVIVQYSTDDGATWSDGEEFTLSSSKPSMPFKCVIGSSVDNVMLRFSVGKTKVSSTSRVTIDDVKVYGSKFDFSIGDGGYAVFYTDEAYVMPHGVMGGVVTKADINAGTLTVRYDYSEGDVVPANTPLLLKGERGDYVYDVTACDESMPVDNLLHGSDAVDSDGNTYVAGQDVRYYVFSCEDEAAAPCFHWATTDGQKVEYRSPNVFLAVDLGSANKTPSVFSIGDKDSNISVNSIDNQSLKEGKVYSVTGVRLDVGSDMGGLPSGVYIKNGKKVIVK